MSSKGYQAKLAVWQGFDLLKEEEAYSGRNVTSLHGLQCEEITQYQIGSLY